MWKDPRRNSDVIPLKSDKIILKFFNFKAGIHSWILYLRS